MKLPSMFCARPPQRWLGHGIIWLVGTLVAASCGSALADDYLDPIGGSGGGPFEAHCPAGQLLVGFELRAADDVDAIRPLCATASGPRDVGPAAAESNWYGGGGGRPTRVVCTSYKPVVTGMFVRSEGQDTEVVNNIHLFCGIAVDMQERSNSPSALFDAPHSGPGGAFSGSFGRKSMLTQHCPDGEVAVGVHGRSGLWLDAIGLICGTAGLPARPAVPAPPPAMRQPSAGTTLDGTGKRSSVSTVASIGKDKPATRPAHFYAIGADGELRWYRLDTELDGRLHWRGPRWVKTGWGNFRQVFGGGEGVIYAVDQRGTLLRYEHAGYEEGLGINDAGAWRATQTLAGGFGDFRQVFSAGEGVIYAITGDGKLMWYRFAGFANGKAIMQGPKEVGRGWGGLQAFSGGGGVLYTISPDGTLRWYRHLKYLTGEGLDASDAWATRREVASGWNGFKFVFSSGDGRIYALAQDGHLALYHHKGFRTGDSVWDPIPQQDPGFRAPSRLFAQIAVPGTPVTTAPSGQDQSPSGQDPLRPICDAARNARARNSPAAPNLEAQCRAAGGTP